MSSEFHKRQASTILKALTDGHKGYSALEILQLCLYLKASAARKAEYQAAFEEAVKFVASIRPPERFQFEWATLAGDAAEAARYLSSLPATEIDVLLEDDDAIERATPWRTLKLEDLFVFSEEGDGPSPANTAVAAKSASTFIVFSGLLCGFNDNDLNKWIGAASVDRIVEQHRSMMNQLWPAGTTAVGITEALQIRLFQMGFNTIRAIGGRVPNGAPFALLREPKVTLMLLGPDFWRTFRESGLTPALAQNYGVTDAERTCLAQIAPAVPNNRATAAAVATAPSRPAMEQPGFAEKIFTALGLDKILDEFLARPSALAFSTANPKLYIGRFRPKTGGEKDVMQVYAEVFPDGRIIRLTSEGKMVPAGGLLPADVVGCIAIPMVFKEKKKTQLVLDSLEGYRMNRAERDAIVFFIDGMRAWVGESFWARNKWDTVEERVRQLHD